MRIKNPVLPGFHPDPSLVRVGDWFYLANSTFEWFGGVEIHRSRDLKNWEFATRPLADRSMLDMLGNPASGGIWAPCLSHDGNRFWLIFTDVKTWNTGPFKDCHNYVTSAPDIMGPWDPPTYLNSSGFDASLFHDGERTWYVNMEWDYRQPGSKVFSGILLQEFDKKTRTLFGPVKKIFTGSDIGLVEGPHLYKREGWYYLLVAEGGTEYGHAGTMARSRNVDGPYELSPFHPLVSTRGAPDHGLQKAGHASITEMADGTWMLACLTGRPVADSGRCTLGRETSLAPLVWKDGWPRLAQGGPLPPLEFDCSLPEHPVAPGPGNPAAGQRIRYDFVRPEAQKDFMSLRIPLGDRLDLASRPGWARLRGAESIVSCHTQSVWCRRQSDESFQVKVRVDFTPRYLGHMAGLLYRYDEANQYYLRISWDQESQQRTLGILVMDAGKFDMPLGRAEVPVSDGEVWLGLEVKAKDAQFWWSRDGASWKKVGPVLDATKISDDYHSLGFTGAFVGMAAQDLSHHSTHADFTDFEYAALDSQKPVASFG